MRSLELVASALPNIQSCPFKGQHGASSHIPCHLGRHAAFLRSVCRIYQIKDQPNPAPISLPAAGVGMAACAMAVCT